MPYGNTFYQTSEKKVANSLETHFQCPLFIKVGKLMLPDATIVHINILAFLVEDASHAQRLTSTLNNNDFPHIEIRKLTNAEIELFSDIPRSARNILHQETNHIITPHLTQAIYSAFLAASCPHNTLSLYPSLFAAYPPSYTCANHQCRCGALLSSNITNRVNSRTFSRTNKPNLL